MNESVFDPEKKDKGYSVISAGFMSNVETRTDAGQKKSDKEVNILNATSISMELQEVSMVKNTEVLAKVEVEPGIASCPKLTWESSNEEVAIVDDKLNGNVICEDGVARIIATGAGEATISATTESGMNCSVKVSVMDNEETEATWYLINSEESWNEALEAGVLQKYYDWSDEANKPYKEDLLYVDPETGATRPANGNDMGGVDENGHGLYPNCIRCWQGAYQAPGAKYPWAVVAPPTPFKGTIRFTFNETEYYPWGEAERTFGRGFAIASIPEELGIKAMPDEEGTNFKKEDLRIDLVLK